MSSVLEVMRQAVLDLGVSGDTDGLLRACDTVSEIMYAANDYLVSENDFTRMALIEALRKMESGNG